MKIPKSLLESASINNLSRPSESVADWINRLGSSRGATKGPSSLGRRGSTTGVEIIRSIPVPPILEDTLRGLEDESPNYITRHISPRHLQANINGYFRFGTIESYKPADNQLIARLSDVQEGSLWETFESRTGAFDQICIQNNIIIQNSHFVGYDNAIVIIHIVNDYCSCSSIGHFHRDRAVNLRQRGNPDIGAYVVYDLGRLKGAIREIIAESQDNIKDMVLLGRNVIYGQKDRSWDILGGKASIERDLTEIWLGAVFIKSHEYEHEQEYRMLLLNPHNAGRLAEKTGPYEIKDPRIAEAIVDHGEF